MIPSENVWQILWWILFLNEAEYLVLIECCYIYYGALNNDIKSYNESFQVSVSDSWWFDILVMERLIG